MKIKMWKHIGIIFGVICAVFSFIFVGGIIVALILSLLNLSIPSILSERSAVFFYLTFVILLVCAVVFDLITEQIYKKSGICPRCEGGRTVGVKTDVDGRQVAKICHACKGTGKYIPEVYRKWKNTEGWDNGGRTMGQD